MNVLCFKVNGTCFLVESTGNELAVRFLNEKIDKFEGFKVLQVETKIVGMTLCQTSDLVALIVIITNSGFTLIWAPSFESICRVSSFLNSTDVVLCPQRNCLLLSSGSTSYLSSPITPNDTFDIRGEALKLTAELGAVNQLLQSDDDVIVNLVGTSSGSSSSIVILKSEFSAISI